MTQIQWQVQGMTCGGCSGRLNRVLQGLDGIGQAQADHVGHRVDVDYDPRRISPEQIRAAINEAGFEVVDA